MCVLAFVRSVVHELLPRRIHCLLFYHLFRNLPFFHIKLWDQQSTSPLGRRPQFLVVVVFCVFDVVVVTVGVFVVIIIILLLLLSLLLLLVCCCCCSCRFRLSRSKTCTSCFFWSWVFVPVFVILGLIYVPSSTPLFRRNVQNCIPTVEPLSLWYAPQFTALCGDPEQFGMKGVLHCFCAALFLCYRS